MTADALALRELAAGYGRVRVLDGIDLSIARGEWFALLGPNGSGKSTLLQCVSGQLAPFAGAVEVGGHSMATAPQAAKSALGYAHPPDRLPALLTGRQCLEVYAAARDLQAIDPPLLALARELGLDAALDRFVDTYSLGMRQKLSVLLALLGDPPLIVLDEVFNGLDPASALVLKRHLADRVAAGRCAVLLATHALDIVLSCATRAGLLLDGRLARSWGAPELRALRRDDPAGLEAALVEAARTARPADLAR